MWVFEERNMKHFFFPLFLTYCPYCSISQVITSFPFLKPQKPQVLFIYFKNYFSVCISVLHISKLCLLLSWYQGVYHLSQHIAVLSRNIVFPPNRFPPVLCFIGFPRGYFSWTATSYDLPRIMYKCKSIVHSHKQRQGRSKSRNICFKLSIPLIRMCSFYSFTFL